MSGSSFVTADIFTSYSSNQSATKSDPAVNVRVEETTFGGRIALQFVVTLAGSNTGDLRGIFFDIPAAYNGVISTLKVQGSDLTSSKFSSTPFLTLGGDVNMSGDSNRHSYNAGVEIGSSGMGKDDIHQTSFLLYSASDNLSLSLVSGVEFGARLTSVGVAGGTRGQSLKLFGASGAVQTTTPVTVTPPVTPVLTPTGPSQPQVDPGNSLPDGTGTTTPTAGDDAIDGGEGDDAFSGGDGADIIKGGSGNDALYGNQGNDTISGNSGNDTLYAGQGDDSLGGGSGDDTVYGDRGNDTLFGGEGNDELSDGQGQDLIYGNMGEDTIYANTENDTVYGGRDADKIYAADGDDRVYGNRGDDLIESGAGNDYAHGGFDNDEIQGEGGDDTISGGLDNGSIVTDGASPGRAVSEVVVGDNLYGNDGDDTFLFKAGHGIDMIWDIQPGHDKILVSGYSINDMTVSLIGDVVNEGRSNGYPLDAGHYDKMVVSFAGKDAIVFNDFPNRDSTAPLFTLDNNVSLSASDLWSMAV